ncbi:hypothetical protein B0H63DRAFT_518761 [Podospora didyma]|uniref:NADH-cytochrome b5 reductase n=1 Tax=Podospora didyma TaxID=330526 RepID=A0AAE0U3H4_9PEZI|nr:hypothetical protein B0H63DRAFT_518761 [Podospora didyma]
MSSTQVAVAAAVAGLGVYALFLRKGPDAADKPKKNLGSFGLHRLTVHSTELISNNVKRVRFELPNKSQPSGLALTSALLTISMPSGSWVPVPRPYTPVNSLDEPGFVELMVKHYPGGKASTHIHSLKPGDTLTVLPIPGFAWAPNKHSHVALIAGGAGITPMYQLTQGILNNPEDKTSITLVWGVNTDDEIFLKEEFGSLQKKFPDRFKAVYVVAKPDAASPHPKGFITKEILEEAGLSATSEKNKDIKVLVCGPPPMEKAMKGAKKEPGVLTKLGYTPGQIYSF